VNVPRNRAAESRNIERTEQVFELKLAGLSFAEIGRRVGISKTYAFKLYRTAVEWRHDEIRSLVDRERVLESERLEAVIAAHWPDRANPKSAHVILSALDRKARLFGLDAPQRFEHSGTIEHESADERRRRIISETADAVAAMTPEQLAAEAASLLGDDEASEKP
jgi:hypothetical protein